MYHVTVNVYWGWLWWIKQEAELVDLFQKRLEEEKQKVKPQMSLCEPNVGVELLAC